MTTKNILICGVPRGVTTIIQGGNDPTQALNDTWRKVELKYDKKQLARRKSMGFSTNPNIKRGKPK